MRKKQIIISMVTSLICIIFLCIIYTYKNDMNNYAIESGLNDYVVRGHISIWFTLNIFGILTSVVSMITILFIGECSDTFLYMPVIICNTVPVCFIVINIAYSLSVLFDYVKYMLF